MNELRQWWKFKAEPGGPEAAFEHVRVQRVGVVDGAIGGPERFTSLAALFPNVEFVSIGPAWPSPTPADCDVLIASVDGGLAGAVDTAAQRISAYAGAAKVVIVLSDADVGASRRLVREGAADVLPAPVNEPSLALCLERLLVANRVDVGDNKGAGEVIAVLKAGGGSGATTLAVQAGAILAARAPGQVCLVDLDLQFGAGALYLDLPDAVTLMDCLSTGGRLEDTPFATALATHRSGLRMLAAPRELTPLDAMSADQAESLLKGLRRAFALTILDMPSVWTDWTIRLLKSADRIVLVSQLTVPHINLVKRQLRMLAAQLLDTTPLILVCNALSAEQQTSLSVKAAERSIGRPFDIVIPADGHLMNAAINQGVSLSTLRRGTKIEKAIMGLVEAIAAGVAAVSAPRVRP